MTKTTLFVMTMLGVCALVSTVLTTATVAKKIGKRSGQPSPTYSISVYSTAGNLVTNWSGVSASDYTVYSYCVTVRHTNGLNSTVVGGAVLVTPESTQGAVCR